MKHAPWLGVVQTLMPEIRESARAAERSGRLPEHVVVFGLTFMVLTSYHAVRRGGAQ